jgi:hypothetical protein
MCRYDIPSSWTDDPTLSDAKESLAELHAANSDVEFVPDYRASVKTVSATLLQQTSPVSNAEPYSAALQPRETSLSNKLHLQKRLAPSDGSPVSLPEIAVPVRGNLPAASATVPQTLRPAATEALSPLQVIPTRLQTPKGVGGSTCWDSLQVWFTTLLQLIRNRFSLSMPKRLDVELVWHDECVKTSSS